MGTDGFEPPKVKTSRFTVCPIWPLWNMPILASTSLIHLALTRIFALRVAVGFGRCQSSLCGSKFPRKFLVCTENGCKFSQKFSFGKRFCHFFYFWLSFSLNFANCLSIAGIVCVIASSKVSLSFSTKISSPGSLTVTLTSLF